MPGPGSALHRPPRPARVGRRPTRPQQSHTPGQAPHTRSPQTLTSVVKRAGASIVAPRSSGNSDDGPHPGCRSGTRRLTRLADRPRCAGRAPALTRRVAPRRREDRPNGRAGARCRLCPSWRCAWRVPACALRAPGPRHATLLPSVGPSWTQAIACPGPLVSNPSDFPAVTSSGARLSGCHQGT